MVPTLPWIAAWAAPAALAAPVVEEVHADPGTTGLDANCDGVVDDSDGFVEVRNLKPGAVNLGGWTLEDSLGIWHSFDPGVLPAGHVILIYAGGTPDLGNGGPAWCADDPGPRVNVLLASSARPLNPAVDTLSLLPDGGSLTYDPLDAPAASLVRSPAGGGPLVDHQSVSIWAASPGFQTDGAPWGGGPAPDTGGDMGHSGRPDTGPADTGDTSDTAIDTGTPCTPVSGFVDGDGDTFGDEEFFGCDPPANVVPNGGDCDDADPTVHPGASELCNGADDDCDATLPAEETDGDVDGAVTCTFDAAGWRGDPTVVADADCDDADPDMGPLAVMDLVCDGLPADCVLLQDTERDMDADGFVACTLDAGGWDGPVAPTGGDDCNDADATVFPDAPELCDGLANTCGALPFDESDLDSDGFVACTLDAGGWDGPVAPTGGDDCNDADDTVFPDAPELCDGLANACGTLPANETDVDDDGFVACTLDAGGWDGPVAPTGGDDCNDDDDTVFPTQIDACGDGIDNDCDDLGDHASPGVGGYLDDDADGLSFADEVALQTSDCAADTDRDGVNDPAEVLWGTDPVDDDSDDDSVIDGDEVDDLPLDTDGDGLIDPLDADDDGDGVPTVAEDVDSSGTPLDDDSDFDGAPNFRDDDDDGDTVLTANERAAASDPLNADSDGDFLDDGAEWRNTLWEAADCDVVVTVDGVPMTHCYDLDGGSTGLAEDDPWDRDADGAINALDTDDDGDGRATFTVEGTADQECLPLGSPGDAVPSYLDFDSDGDGLLDVSESDGDEDGDSLRDWLDCDATGCSGDSDGDGLPNCVEVALTGDVESQNKPDVDRDLVSDGAEVGSDPNCFDPLALLPCLPLDTDGDDEPDLLDEDDDDDGASSHSEYGLCPDGTSAVLAFDDVSWGAQCPDGSALSPRNTDAPTGGAWPLFPDDIPDRLDPDDDGDGVTPEGDGDADGDGLSDRLDPNDGDGPDADADADGLDNGTEMGLGTDPFDRDTDDDGVDDGDESTGDTDGDGLIDALDSDDDGDGIPTLVEGSADIDGDGLPARLDTDSDGDGIADVDEVAEDADCDGLDARIDADETDGPCALGPAYDVPPYEGASCGGQSTASAALPWLALLGLRRRRAQRTATQSVPGNAGDAGGGLAAKM